MYRTRKKVWFQWRWPFSAHNTNHFKFRSERLSALVTACWESLNVRRCNIDDPLSQILPSHIVSQATVNRWAIALPQVRYYCTVWYCCPHENRFKNKMKPFVCLLYQRGVRSRILTFRPDGGAVVCSRRRPGRPGRGSSRARLAPLQRPPCHAPDSLRSQPLAESGRGSGPDGAGDNTKLCWYPWSFVHRPLLRVCLVIVIVRLLGGYWRRVRWFSKLVRVVP